MRPVSTVFYGFLVIVIGILLIVFHTHTNLLDWVVILAGITLIIPCLYTLITTLSGERKARRGGYTSFNTRMMTSGIVLTSVIGIALGVWLVATPAFFIGFLAYAFAILLIIYGLYHICVLVWFCRPVAMPIWFYIIPVLLIVAGVVILGTSVREIQATVILITGIGLVASGFSSITEYVVANRPVRPTESGR